MRHHPCSSRNASNFHLSKSPSPHQESGLFIFSLPFHLYLVDSVSHSSLCSLRLQASSIKISSLSAQNLILVTISLLNLRTIVTKLRNHKTGTVSNTPRTSKEHVADYEGDMIMRRYFNSNPVSFFSHVPNPVPQYSDALSVYSDAISLYSAALPIRSAPDFDFPDPP